MKGRTDLESRLRLFSRAAGIAASLIGGLVLVGGWLLDIVALRSVPLGSVSMKANTALGLAAAGAALWLLQDGASRRRRLAGLICAALPALIGLLTLAEYGLGRGLGIDELLFTDPDAVAPQVPGRPALNTSLALLLLGVSFLTLDRETRGGRQLKDVLPLVAGLIALAGLLGHAADEQALLSFMPYSAMALHTAVALLLLAGGLLAARPRRGLMRAVSDASAGEGASRALAVIGFVVALGLFADLVWIALRHAARMQDMAVWVARTHEVQAGLNRLLSLVGDIQAGGRGFVVTGDPAFLEPLELGVNAVAEQQGSLGQLILDDEQKAGLTALEPLIAERIAVSRRLVELRRNSGFEPARQELASGRGNAVSDQIHAVIARMDARQKTLLDQRSAAARRQLGNLERVTVTGGVLGMALLVGGFALVLHENRLRSLAEGTLRAAHDELERRVRERTAELELERSKLTAAFENTNMGLVLSDGQGGNISMNAAALRFHGFKSVAEMHEKIDEYADQWELRDLDGPILPFAEWPLPRAIRGESFRDCEIHLRNVESGYEWVCSYTGVPVRNSAGEVSLIVLTLLDITERTRLEERLRRSNVELGQRVKERTHALEAANKELEAFSYSVSHDLRAPLRAIDGFSQVLLEDHGGRLDAEGRGHLERIRAAAQRMGGLIEDLLMLSRITQGELRRQAVDLSALVGKVAEELRRREPDRAVSFAVEPGLVAQADPRLLRIALENVIGNAWKFTRNTAEARIWFGASRADGGVSYSVRDNGAGFDMAYADKLFAPFQRLHSPREFEGTGIGLAIVARVIHRHGGEIRAEAAVGHGATFHFTLGPGDAEADRKEAKA